MYLGTKASCRDIGNMLAISQNIEVHTFGNDFEGFGKLRDSLAPFKGKIRKLAVHAPVMLDPSAFLDIGAGVPHRAFATKIAGSVSPLSSDYGALPLVFHAPSVASGAKDPKTSLESVTKFIDSAPDGPVIALENMPESCWRDAKMTELAPTKLFHESDDFGKLFEMVRDQEKAGITLDVCHFFMGRHAYSDLEDMVSSFPDKIVHVHISDLMIKDPYKTEGTQIGDGDLDFGKIFDILSQIRRDVMVIPEIRDGHKENGKGFKEAFSRLTAFL